MARSPDRVSPFLIELVETVIAPGDFETGHGTQRIVGAQKDDQRFETGLGVLAMISGELAGHIEKGQPSVRLRGRVDPQGGSLGVVLHELVEDVVLRDGHLCPAVVGCARQGVSQIPAVHAEIVVETGDVGNRGARSALPVVLDLVHEVTRSEQRHRQFPERQCRSEPLLESAQQQLQVDREPAGPGITRVAVLGPAQFVGDDCRVGDVGVEDGTALKNRVSANHRWPPVDAGEYPPPRSPPEFRASDRTAVVGDHSPTPPGLLWVCHPVGSGHARQSGHLLSSISRPHWETPSTRRGCVR